MKKILVAGLLVLAAGAQAQKTSPAKPGAKPVAAKPAQAANPLKNSVDSVSYAIGTMVANFYKQQGISNLNSAMVAKAVSDIYGNKKVLLNEAQANMALMRYMNPALSKNIEDGEKFLAANKKKAGVKTTPSGLQYEVITEGKGPRPAATDTVTVNYAGTLINGTQFDKNDGISFPLNGVIPGWTEALQLMPAGSKYKLYIPYQLAYGLNDQGPIPGGSVLVFEVDLVAVKGKQ
ncbi:MAG TPA: FKBP-type peptidyl-prolyl cis-trans isomerase [Flavisolibacter sp.]|nr:FKBP-type peptidyl-prolyl cis-trans isomerase [Flavisolibacter sp.]